MRLFVDVSTDVRIRGIMPRSAKLYLDATERNYQFAAMSQEGHEYLDLKARIGVWDLELQSILIWMQIHEEGSQDGCCRRPGQT